MLELVVGEVDRNEGGQLQAIDGGELIAGYVECLERLEGEFVDYSEFVAGEVEFLHRREVRFIELIEVVDMVGVEMQPLEFGKGHFGNSSQE